MNIVEFFNLIGTLITSFTWVDYVGILVLFVIFFFLFDLLSKSKAYIMVPIFIAIVLLLGLFSINLKVNKFAYIVEILISILSIVILFSLEIKRLIWSIKDRNKVSTYTQDQVIQNQKVINNNINEMIKAIQNMSKDNVGAIIILTNTKLPADIINSGVTLNAQISSSLIQSIFFPKTPLHDGAMIIQDNLICAAGCFLPLSQNTSIPKELGTRHRAGVGITENIDVTSIIVSEETGVISIAKSGRMMRYASSEDLKKVLRDFFWIEVLGK